jgi:hypothetical protein
MGEARLDWSPETAARWLAEAVETGNGLAPLPEEIAPRNAVEGRDVALAVLERLEIRPCGLRLLYRPGREPLIGPMVEERMVPPGSPIAKDALRHPVATAAVIGVLAAPLEPGSVQAPRFKALHPAIDVAATRYSEATDDAAALSADLARLGWVVAGRAKFLAPLPVTASLGTKGSRRQAVRHDLAAAFAEAATAARDLGGLPAGGLLVLAGLTPPGPGLGAVSASFGKLGRVEASWA